MPGYAVCVCLALCLCAATDGPAWDWNHSYVEYRGYSGVVVVNAQGLVSVAYRRDSALKVERYTGGAWVESVIAYPGSTQVGPVMELDSLGMERVAYEMSGAVTLASWTGSGWSIKTIDSGIALPSDRKPIALACDQSGRAHLAYTDHNIGFLKYAVQNGSGYDVESSAISAVVEHTSLALDSAAYPHVVYRSGNDFRCAYKDGTGWHSEFLFTTNDVVYWAAKIDSSDRLCIAYGGNSDGGRYSRRDGEGWHHETFDTTANVKNIQLRLDNSDDPHVAYLVWSSYAAQTLKYAWRSGGGWSIDSTTSGDYCFNIGFDIDPTSHAPRVAHRYGYHMYVAYGGSLVPPISANFSADVTSGNAPLTVSFTDMSVGGPSAWAWDFGNGATSTEQHPTVTYSNSGVYTVSLYVSGASGSGTAYRPGMITVGNPVWADFEASRTSGRPPIEIEFTDTSQGEITHWSWDFGDGGTSTAQNPSHTYDTDGAYTVSLTVSNESGGDTEVKTGYITLLDEYPDVTACYQRPGETLIDIFYALHGEGGPHSMTFELSTDSGHTFLLPYHSEPASPGDVLLATWDLDGVVPDNCFKVNCKVKATVSVGGVLASDVSDTFTVDFRGFKEELTVLGRVVDADTGLPMSGAGVLLGGTAGATGGDGTFTFTGVTQTGGTALAVSSTGYRSYSGNVEVPAGGRFITVPDVALHLDPGEGEPIVTKLEARYNGLFLDSVHVANVYKATVDWDTATPASVAFFANEDLIEDVSGSGTTFTCTVDIAEHFVPSYNPLANQLRAVAKTAGGPESEPAISEVWVIPLSYPLALLASTYPFSSYATGRVSLNADIPSQPVDQTFTLPVLGEFGAKLGASLAFDYGWTDGKWQLIFGTSGTGGQERVEQVRKDESLGLFLFGKTFTGKFEGQVKGTATIANGIVFSEAVLFGELAGKIDLGRWGITDLLGPGAGSVLGRIPLLGGAVRSTSIVLFAQPGIQGQAIVGLDPEVAFKNTELSGFVGIEAEYEPKLRGIDGRIYVGGKPTLTLQYPTGPLFKQFNFKAYAGFEFKWKIVKVGPTEYVFVDYTYPASFAGPGGPRNGRPRFVLLPAAGNTAELKPLDRSYLDRGPEQFVLADEATFAPDTSQKLAAFRSLGRPFDTRDAEEPTSQVDLTLVANTFPFSRPSLAASGSELMLVYDMDGGGSNDLQFTDISWTRFDGSDWSVPTSLVADTRAEFSPQVRFDGNGDAIAVWERISDPNFTNLDITAIAAELEIVWSRWQSGSGTWSTPVPLTTNSYLDTEPMLCGPMGDGDLMLVWNRNDHNLLAGEGPVGSVSNSAALWSRWDATTSAWSMPSVLVSNMRYRLSHALAGASNRVIYAWTSDADGVTSNDWDQELFYSAWGGASWGPGVRYTTNGVADKTVRAAAGPDGEPYLVWQSGADLVMSRGPSAAISVVRADSQSAGFGDFELTAGEAGNLVLLWQEMTEFGSDAHYCVYDPLADAWGQDGRLFTNAPLERAFAPVWDDAGNLAVAYNRVDIHKTNMTVELEGGETVVVTNVPQPGQVDLCVVKRSLVKDLAIEPGDFTATADNFMPGAAVNLGAVVRNVGDLAVSNVVVSFYDDPPASGGALIANVVVPGWLPAQASHTVTNTWIIPEPASNRTLSAIVDFAGQVAEFREDNNAQALAIGGVDLEVTLLSHQAHTTGTVRVFAQVRNAGAPGATNSVLAIRREGEGGAALATVDVPALEPGILAQVALDLPAGTQAEGSTLYTLFADDTDVTGDVDTNNNAVTFGAFLWLDTDGDGMPNGWETDGGLDPTNAADRTLDRDGDGFLNWQEFRANTDPDDPDSFLQMVPVRDDEATGGVLLKWSSASNRLYTIQKRLMELPWGSFTTMVEHVQSTPPTNTYVDLYPTNNCPVHYVIEVE